MHSSRIAVLCAISALVATSFAAVISSRKQCTLDAHGKPICTFFKAGEIIPSLRQSSCAESDHNCMCQRAVELTNAIRRKNGKSNDLKAGPQAMLDNAVEHSKEMKNGLGMEHQNLEEATNKVGCGVFVNRENIAMNGGMDVDPVEQCIEQWENSEGHFANIIADNDYVVVGTYSDGGENWCTQTFGSQESPSPGGANCAPVSGGGSSMPEGTTSAPATTKSMEKPVTESMHTTPKMMEETVTVKTEEEAMTTKGMEHPVVTKKHMPDMTTTTYAPTTSESDESPEEVTTYPPMTSESDESPEEVTTYPPMTSKSDESPEEGTKPCPDGGSEDESPSGHGGEPWWHKYYPGKGSHGRHGSH